MRLLNWIKENYLLLLIVVFAAILRLYKIDFQSPWIDEIFTLYNTGSDKNFIDIYRFLRDNDPHPPLYYFIVHFFYLIFENTSLIARLISVIFGLGGIVIFYHLVKELFNKNAALIAVVLLAVNYFHIYHSQEARMYSMLFFTTTISFYFLIKFIKNPTFKWAILHGIVVSTMIYTHFFAIFTLLSHYLILLYFIIYPVNLTSFKFFKLSVFSGITTLILYIPAIFVLLKTGSTTSFWIPTPTPDVYTIIIKDFFGHCEIAIYISIIAALSYFVSIFNKREAKELKINPLVDRSSFAFMILSMWILVTIFIPLFFSYANLPMIVNRYFINILPVVLIFIAVGLAEIRSNLIKIVLITSFVVFSLNDLIVVKKYYSTPTKSQFKEITTEIKEKNLSKAKVVTYWSWLLPYYFDKSTGIYVQGNTLQEYVSGLKNGSNNYSSFWYLDGHYRAFDLSQEDQDFLKQHFTIKYKLEYLNCWAYYYQALNSAIKKELSLKDFKTEHRDQNGHVNIFENGEIYSDEVYLESGTYQIVFSGNSLPETPIDNENAHIILKVDGNIVADFYLDDNINQNQRIFDFVNKNPTTAAITIIYDNDILINERDRNVLIRSLSLKKVK